MVIDELKRRIVFLKQEVASLEGKIEQEDYNTIKETNDIKKSIQMICLDIEYLREGYVSSN